MKLYRIAQHGEWWIIDGSAVYADQDTGDIGHEAYVVDSLRREIAEFMDYYFDAEYYDWDEVKVSIVSNLVQRYKIDGDELIEKYGDDYIDQIPYNSDIFDSIAVEYGVDKEKIDIADGSGDARDYGMKKLGWKRVHGQYIQTYTMTQSDLRSIANGLADAFGDDDNFEEMHFTIEVTSNEKMYYDIPYEIIDTQNPMKIIPYGGQYNAFKYTKTQIGKFASNNIEGFLNQYEENIRGLVSEALKCETFEDFKNDFLSELKHGIYWHLTDNPNFSIDLLKGPRDMSSVSALNGESPGSLMVTSDLEYWVEEYPNRKYAVQIDLSNVPRSEYRQVNRGFGNEFFIQDASKAKVIGSMSVEKAIEIDEQNREFLPSSYEKLKRFYDDVMEKYKKYNNLKSFAGQTVYHGGENIEDPPILDYSKSPKGQNAGGIFFSPNIDYAKKYMRHPRGLYKYEISDSDIIFDINNPKHVRQFIDNSNKWEDYRNSQDARRDALQIIQLMKDASTKDGVDWATGSQFVELMEQSGFDGAKLIERLGKVNQIDIDQYDVEGEPIVSYVLFRNMIPVERNVDNIVTAQTQESKEIMQKFKKMFGLGEFEPKIQYHKCPKCKKILCRWKETHPDTDISEIVQYCKNCGEL